MNRKVQIRNLLLPGNRFSIKFCWYLILVTLVFCSTSFFNKCRQYTKPLKNVERSIYFWKSVFAPTDYEKIILHDLEISTLYLKFFDVDWDNNIKQSLPVAQLRINDTGFLKTSSVKIIPVVFITNSCIKNIDSLQAIQLGEKILILVNSIAETNHLEFTELQIDCDWTAATKEKYFTLLRSVKNNLKEARKISATIRLYQIKYSIKTGIPPVDHGMLMAYNMGNLKDPATQNSILETEELKKYISNLSSYPLPLDVGLPLFEWKVLFRNESYAGLIENLPDTFFKNKSIKKKSANQFQFLNDTILNGYSFFKGDIVRKEESTYDEILSAEKIISENLSSTDMRLSLFHLDSVILKKYTLHEMQNIFSGLR